jgi:hypothetical protein
MEGGELLPEGILECLCEKLFPSFPLIYHIPLLVAYIEIKTCSHLFIGEAFKQVNIPPIVTVFLEPE